MYPQPIYHGGPLFPPRLAPKGLQNEAPKGFISVLDGKTSAAAATTTDIPAYVNFTAAMQGRIYTPPLLQPQQTPLRNPKEAASAYALQAAEQKPEQLGGWRKYKDDQLLRNPGGDSYYTDQKRVAADDRERESFLSRMGKDLSDVWGNVKNFFGNLFIGSKFHYRDENNEIREGTQQGLIGTCVDFLKNLGSALTFGLWNPGEEHGPQGFAERVRHVGSKMKQAFLGDLVEGLPKSVNHMAKNLVLAGLNLVQVFPDATIGNSASGRKLTTTIFDNGQVLVEYLTDVIPSGDAWFRVHAMNLSDGKVPVIYNLEMPEHAKGDLRWQYVRNTRFRKTIETVGTLLADIAAICIAGQSGVSTNQQGGKPKILKDMLR